MYCQSFIWFLGILRTSFSELKRRPKIPICYRYRLISLVHDHIQIWASCIIKSGRSNWFIERPLSTKMFWSLSLPSQGTKAGCALQVFRPSSASTLQIGCAVDSLHPRELGPWNGFPDQAEVSTVRRKANIKTKIELRRTNEGLLWNDWLIPLTPQRSKSSSESSMTTFFLLNYNPQDVKKRKTSQFFVD